MSNQEEHEERPPLAGSPEKETKERKINNSNYYVRLPIIFALTLAAGMFIGAKMFGSDTKDNDVAKNAAKLRDILSYIDMFYVDTVNTDQVTDKAIESLLEELDPHSAYIPKSELEMANAPLQGNFEGVGIEFNIFRDTISVVATINGGPSEQVGILAGDKIVQVNEEKVAGIGMTNKGVVDRLRGERGTKVKVGIARKGKKDLLFFTITRDKIPTYTVDFSEMLDKNTGYIKVTRFGATTYDEFKEALAKLNKKDMKNLILDLRDNGGGYMDRAINMVDELVSGEKLIVFTDGKDDRFDSKAFANFKGQFEKGPVIVLINENSASASEIVTGALQDHDRALIVGRRSFGKGLVQRPIPLLDGSELRLTISRYYTPSGRSIQKPYDNIKDYYMDYVNRYKHGEFFHADSVKVDEKLKYKTSLGRTVYGGGGIIPDYFVPRDTTFYTEYLNQIYSANLLREYAMDYANDNKAVLSAMTYEAFRKDFQVDEKVYGGLLKRAEQEKIKYDEAQFKASKKFITNQLKAYIARGIWKNEGFYPILLDDDEDVQKALGLIEEAKKLEKGKI